MGSAESGSIGRGIRIKGELTAVGDLVIEGEVEGIVRLANDLRVAPGGRLNAEAHADRLTVEGEAHGRLEATTALELAAGATVTGELRAPRVRIAEGASFSGTVQMDVALPADVTPGRART